MLRVVIQFSLFKVSSLLSILLIYWIVCNFAQQFKLFENMEMWACRCRFVNTVHVDVMHYTYYESSLVVKIESK